jgi:transposase
MPYYIAGIDVHKKMLAVVVADVSGDRDYHFEQLKTGTSPAQLRALADWLAERDVAEVVMESTAQYWRPVWEALERRWQPCRARDGAPAHLYLAQAQSNRGVGGRKDFPDAERLVKRLVAQELTLSFVPDVEQRLWRTVMRRRYQLTRNRVQLQNRLEALLEEAHLKLSSLVTDLLGTSARRMLQAVGDGATEPSTVAALADQRLRATPAQLADALEACATLHPVYRRLLTLTLEELRLLEDHLRQLDQQMADLLAPHHEAVHRLAEVPGLGVESAQQIIAEVGVTAATFPSPRHLASWVGACPGHEESAGINHSPRCPKGNRQMRRVLNQAANAAVRAKGTIFAVVYRRLVVRLGHAQAIGATAHRLCRLIWKILHERVRYEERGPAVSAQATKIRTRKMIRALRRLGYRVELAPPTNG